MGWDEAIRMFRILRSDPSTRIAAAVEDWEYPFSRESAIFADLYDLEYAKTGAKGRKPYPRPFKVKDVSVERKGDAGGRTRAEVVEWLRSLGHNVN